MARLRKGDQVVVMRGEHKGARGVVQRVLEERGLVVIEGVNQVKRHVKASPQRGGGILEMEAPLRASKIMLVDPVTGKPTRVRRRVEEGKKVRVAKSGAVIQGN